MNLSLGSTILKALRRLSPDDIGKTARLPQPRGSLRALTLAAALCAGASASAQVASHGFEGGTTQGWGPRGPVTLSASTDIARGGAYSLKTTGRTGTWNGPALDLTSILSPNVTYQITGWARLVSGQPQSNLKFTVQQGGSTFTQVNAALPVTDSAWVRLQGEFLFTDPGAGALSLYLESDNATSAYYLDDFTIVALSGFGCPEPLDQTGLFADFEGGGNEGWFGRGSASVANVTVDAYDSGRSLAVTGRTASWNGAAIDALCKIHTGSKYLVSVWVKMLPGQPTSQVRVSLQAGLDGATSFLTVIGNTTVTDGAWVNLVTEYTFANSVDQLQLYVETASGTASFYIDEFVLEHLPPNPIQTDIPSVKDVLADYFPVGAAISPQETVGQHGQLTLKHFSSITATNAMKWDALQPTEGNFNFAPADVLADFARDNGLLMRGHTLQWHTQVPAWLFRTPGGDPLQPGNAAHRDLLLQRLRTHIHAVVARYGDIVSSWDVVNEVIDSNQPGGLRNSQWLQIIGPEFIDYAFIYAAEVAGDAALYINDYGTEAPAKRAALKNVVQGLLDRGVPVDGVGHQFHINIEYPSLQALRDTLQTFADMGLDNQITELDISVYTNSADTAPVPEETLAELGYRYRDVFDVFRDLSDIISSVTFWGLADDTSWLKTFPITRDDKPLLFDEQLQAKWAYWGVVDPSMLPIQPKSLNVARGLARVDGIEEANWEILSAQALESSGDAETWGTFKAMWNFDKLYLLVDVDDALASGDLVEVFVEDAVFQFSGLGAQPASGASAIIVSQGGGYRLEAAIPVGIQLMEGDQVSFDIRVTDSGGRQASWSDTRHSQDEDSEDFGTLQLARSKVTAIATRATPKIDGIEDSHWRRSMTQMTRSFTLGNSGATARFRTLWDNGYLYVWAEVSDPLLSDASANAHEEDSVEIFIDQNNAQTSTYQGDDAQYRINFKNVRSFGGAASAGNITSATRITSSGYIVEAAIRLPEADLSANSFIGFDLQVNNDANGDGTRDSAVSWSDTTGNAYQDPSQFGVLRLR